MNPLEYQRWRIHLNGDAFGARGTPHTIRELLRPLPRTDVVQLGAKILHHLERPGNPYSRERQSRFLDLFPDPFRREAAAMLSRGGDEEGVDVLFNRNQVLAMMRLSLALGTAGPPRQLDRDEIWSVVLASLHVNDIIDDYTSRWKRGGLVLANRDVAIWQIRNVAMNESITYITQAGRADLIWNHSRVPWPSSLEEPPALANRVFGCDMTTAMAIVAAPMFTAMSGADQGDPAMAVIHPTNYFADHTGIDPTVAQTVLAHFTYTPDPPSIVDTEAVYFNTASVEARPYMAATEDLLAVASPGLVGRRATTGTFWLLHEDARQRGRSQTFTGHFGRMFQDYALRLAEATMVSATRLVRDEISFGKPEHDSSDILICQLGPHKQARVFIEVSTIRPTQPLFNTGDDASFDRYVELIRGKLKQLDESIKHHQQGRFRIKDDPLPADATYVPLLVVDEPFQWSEQLRDVIESAPTIASMFRHPAVTKPIIISIGEYEALSQAVESGHDLVELLLGFTSTGRAVGFDWFLHDRCGRIEAPSVVRDGWDRITESWLDALRLPPASGQHSG